MHNYAKLIITLIMRNSKKIRKFSDPEIHVSLLLFKRYQFSEGIQEIKTKQYFCIDVQYKKNINNIISYKGTIIANYYYLFIIIITIIVIIIIRN